MTICDWHRAGVFCDWHRARVFCDWQRAGVLCDWQRARVLCDWQRAGVLSAVLTQPHCSSFFLKSETLVSHMAVMSMSNLTLFWVSRTTYCLFKMSSKEVSSIYMCWVITRENCGLNS